MQLDLSSDLPDTPSSLLIYRLAHTGKCIVSELYRYLHPGKSDHTEKASMVNGSSCTNGIKNQTRKKVPGIQQQCEC